jgi:pilus assembly protein CpaB
VRKNTIVMVGIAVVFGLLAVFVAQGWLNYQAELSRKTAAPKPQAVATRTIVIASAPLRFGSPLAPDSLREVAWPDEAIPAGTFSTIAELTGEKRIVLASIARNEPILRTKVTGAGQKATLSAVIQDGMRAVTVRVNDVEGVAGFILPGDHVDVLLTRQSSERSSGTNDVVIQNTRVLAIDQLADDAADRPQVARAVTLEVDTTGAQKIALAASLGNLSLMLRRAGEQHMDATRRITTSDLAQTEVIQRAPDAKRFTKVAVTRAANRQEYNVPAEETAWRDDAEAQAASRR